MGKEGYIMLWAPLTIMTSTTGGPHAGHASIPSIHGSVLYRVYLAMLQ